MSFKQRIFLILLSWAVYSTILVRSCADDFCKACFPETIGAKNGAITPDSGNLPPINPYPLGFKWSSIQPDRGAAFDSLMRAIRENTDSNAILEITGRYYEEESKPADHETMGLARAAEVRDLYFEDFPEEKVSLRSRAIEESQGVREGYFEAVSFAWVAPAAKVEELEELEDRIIIRFPANSTEKEYDPKVDDYLRKLAQRVIRSGETISITGHTDNTGARTNNMELGRLRAEQIRSILLKSGVPEEQVIAESKGESQPVAPNSSASGRHKNRRAEVRLIKKQ